MWLINIYYFFLLLILEQVLQQGPYLILDVLKWVVTSRYPVLMPQVVSAPQKTKKEDLLLFGIYCFFCYIFILFTAIFGNLFILEPDPAMFKEEGMDNPDFLTFFQVILWQFLRTLHSINLYFFFLWFVKLTEMPICISDL